MNNTLLFKWCSQLNYPGADATLASLDYYSFPWFFTKHGISFTYDLWHINQMDARYALIIHSNIGYRYFGESEFMASFFDPGPSHIVFLLGVNKYFNNNQEFAVSLSHRINVSPGYYGIISPDNFIEGKRALISRHVLTFIDSVSKFEHIEILSKDLISQAVEEWKNENWVLWRWGDCPSAEFDFEKFASENARKNYKEWPGIIGEWYFNDKKERPAFELSSLAKIWRDTVGSPIIPFDLEERRQMKAYKELKPYIDAHEKMKGK